MVKSVRLKFKQRHQSSNSTDCIPCDFSLKTLLVQTLPDGLTPQSTIKSSLSVKLLNTHKPGILFMGPRQTE